MTIDVNGVEHLREERKMWQKDHTPEATDLFLFVVSETLIAALDRIRVLEAQKLWDSGPNNYDMQDVVDLTKAPYGYCLICGAPNVLRDPGLDGIATCKNGHKYPSCNALKGPSFPLRAYSEKEIADMKREEALKALQWCKESVLTKTDKYAKKELNDAIGRLTQGGDL